MNELLSQDEINALLSGGGMSGSASSDLSMEETQVLDEDVGSNVNVRVGNHVRFKVKPGTVEGRFAGEVTEIVRVEASEEPEGGEN